MCFYDLIARLADWYFFAAFSVFMILLMLVEVLCLTGRKLQSFGIHH